MHPDVHENLREVNSLAASQEELKKKWNMSGYIHRRFIQVYWLW